MNITSIKQQVKRPDRYSIYIDGSYVFSLSEGELLRQGLRINQQLKPADVEQLQADAAVDKAYDRALNQLATRPRSEWEIQQYLKRKSYDEDVVNTIVVKLQQRGYIDDMAFARRWVESRRLLKPMSTRKLQLELRQKRVPDEAVAHALAEDETDELSMLRELVERKRQQSRYQNPVKLMQYLARQGFRYDDIKQAMTDSDSN